MALNKWSVTMITLIAFKKIAMFKMFNKDDVVDSLFSLSFFFFFSFFICSAFVFTFFASVFTLSNMTCTITREEVRCPSG